MDAAVGGIHCDRLQTIRQSSFTRQIGVVPDATMGDVCWALGYALGC